MADDKDTRSERESRSLAGDLLRRATSPEVLAGVAGAAAAARFTKHMVEDSDETEAEDQEELEETGEAHTAGEDQAEDEEEEPGDDEEQETRTEDEPDPEQEPSAEEEPEEREDEPDDDEQEMPEAAAEPDSDGEADPAQDEDAEEREETSDSSNDRNGSVGTDDDRMEILDRARRYAEQLTGHPVEAFSSLEQEERGWRIGLEVVELSRVPSTTDVLGSYELVLSDEGEFVDFRRAHRYYRNSTDDASS